MGYELNHPFFDIIVHEIKPELNRDLLGLCLGFERDKWRIDQFLDLNLNI